MNIEKQFTKALTWLFAIFLLWMATDYLSKFFPEFEVYTFPIVGAFVAVAVYDIRRAIKSNH